MFYYIKSFPDQPFPESSGELKEEPTIHPSSRIYRCRMGSWTDIGPNCSLEETSFGDYSYTAGDVSIIYALIGKFCSIASHVRINPGNHPMERASQHHFTYRKKKYGFAQEDDEEFFQWRREHKCVIGHDVWIGHGAVIMPGVKIGTGAVIGSGAIVTKDVGPYEIAVGVPAHTIKKRFDDQTVEKLLQAAWWDWDRETLEKRFNDFMNVQTLIRQQTT